MGLRALFSSLLTTFVFSVAFVWDKLSEILSVDVKFVRVEVSETRSAAAQLTSPRIPSPLMCLLNPSPAFAMSWQSGSPHLQRWCTEKKTEHEKLKRTVFLMGYKLKQCANFQRSPIFFQITRKEGRTDLVFFNDQSATTVISRRSSNKAILQINGGCGGWGEIASDWFKFHWRKHGNSLTIA